jgi:hypothetical protein
MSNSVALYNGMGDNRRVRHAGNAASTRHSSRYASRTPGWLAISFARKLSATRTTEPCPMLGSLDLVGEDSHRGV